jgi:hypothetical protein
MIEGSDLAMSKTGAFNKSDMASAKRRVLPVRERYRIQVRMIAEFSNSL